MTGAQRGYSLVELMVVLCMVAVIGAIAMVSMRKDATPQAAREVAAIMQEARREAVAHGPVRADVAQALNSTAAARIDYTFNPAGANDPSSQGKVELFLLVEDPSGQPTATWQLQNTLYVNTDAMLWADTSVASSGAGVNPPGQTAVQQRFYYPNGSADANTVYLKSKRPNGDLYRIFVMPLSGNATTVRGW
jgi:prepilin-type N-terminal cleavage/methylation domain-containing protein